MTYRKSITPFMESEITLATEARERGDADVEFEHLERMHVVGQKSTYWHVKAHLLMLKWACRNYKPKELFGQLFRIVGAATKTAIGLVPKGNTGGANVSPFKTMPVSTELDQIINTARSKM